MDYSLFDNILDAIFIYDQEKKIIYCNEASATLVGTSLRRLKPGKLVHEFIKFVDEDIFFMSEGTQGKDEEMKFREIEYITKEGKNGTGLINICPYDVNGQKIWLANVRDMSLEIQLHKKYHVQLEEKEEVIDELKRAKEQLEDYSENLEQMVKARTEELKKANDSMNLMINSLNQGLLVFDEESKCLPIFTNAAKELYAGEPQEGKDIKEVLGLDEKGIENFNKWSKCIFSEIIPFEDAAMLAPTSKPTVLDYTSEDFKYIDIEYFPMRDDTEKLKAVVAVATDKTEEMRAKEAFKEKEEFVSMVMKLIHNKEQFVGFVKDAKNIMNDLVKCSQHETEIFDYQTSMRLLHSIKGLAALYSIKNVHDFAHRFESELSPYKNKSKSERVLYAPIMLKNIETLKRELEDFFLECKSFIGEEVVDGHRRIQLKYKDLEEFSEKLNFEASLKNEFTSKFLKEPIKNYVKGYAELVNDLAKQLGKNINPVKFTGGEIKINPDKYMELFNVLVHVFRNCVDHGIGRPEERESIGKSQDGNIEVSFELEKNGSNKINIVIKDDGQGINAEKIRNKMEQLGLTDIAQKESDEEVIYHIFDSSFSTNEEADEISGRGVGMDAVKQVVEDMGGHVVVQTEKGKGSKFIFSVPYFE